MSSLYESCVYETEGGGSELLMECVAKGLDKANESTASSYRDWLLVICGAFVFFMQAGFAMLCAGCVRKSNVQNTMFKNLMDACGAAIAFFTVGFAVAFGETNTTDITFVGHGNFFSTGDVDYGFWFFQFAFTASAATIVAGTLAERCQMIGYLLYSLFLTGFVYPVVAHTIWSENGFLSAFAKDPFRGIGTIDFAGSGVVHITGGTTAIIATYILGARKGRFHDNRGRLLQTPRVIHGHSMALQLMGTLVLWFGWYGFNCGSALLLNVDHTGQVAALVAVNTSLSAAAGCFSSLLTHLYQHARRTGEIRFDLGKALNGALSALVAITASCGTIENWAALVVGTVAGWLYLLGSWSLVYYRLDDAVDAIPVHLGSGIWGMISVGLFTSPGRLMDAFAIDSPVGLFYELGQGSISATLLGNQVIAVFFILTWVTLNMLPFFMLLNFAGWFRAGSLEELVGLDRSCMRERTYMDDEGDGFSDDGQGLVPHLLGEASLNGSELVKTVSAQ